MEKMTAMKMMKVTRMMMMMEMMKMMKMMKQMMKIMKQQMNKMATMIKSTKNMEMMKETITLGERLSGVQQSTHLNTCTSATTKLSATEACTVMRNLCTHSATDIFRWNRKRHQTK